MSPCVALSHPLDSEIQEESRNIRIQSEIQGWSGMRRRAALSGGVGDFVGRRREVTTDIAQELDVVTTPFSNATA
jgi:hypothetical protein